MLLGGGFVSNGTIELGNASVGGTLSFTGAKLSAPGGIALDARSVRVGYALFLGSSIQDDSTPHAEGSIRLVGARIDGFLCCWKARIEAPNSEALILAGATVRENALFTRGFSVIGTVDLDQATFGEGVDFSGATLSGTEGDALTARQTQVGTSLWAAGLAAEGRIDLTRLSVSEVVDFTDARLGPCPELSAEHLRAGTLEMAFDEPPQQMDLRHATVGVLVDSPDRWPRRIVLWDFRYSQFDDGSGESWRNRLRWLRRDGDLGQRGAWEPIGYAAYLTWALTLAGWILTTAAVAGLTRILKRE
jgi:hypothetical protein